MEEDILFLERLLREDPFPSPLMNSNHTKSSIEEPEHSFKSHVESNFVESLSTHDALIDSSQNLEEFSGPLIPIHIAEEERIRREHAEYISHAELDFKLDSEEEIPVVKNDAFECLDPRDEFDDDDYSSFMFLIYAEVFYFLLSAENKDTIFDPGISD
nr:hypothetical protein [Tanacetum cinerariifolium]